MNNQMVFNTPSGLSPEELQSMFTANLLLLEGVSYSEFNQIYRFGGGAVSGTLNCFGLLFAAAKLSGFLDEDFDLNLSPALFNNTDRARILRRILQWNFTQILPSQGGYQFQSGDILLSRWKDVNHRLGVHHVAAHVGFNPDGSDSALGSQIQSLDVASGGMGRVLVQRIDPLDLSRIEEVHRIKMFIPRSVI